MFPKQLGRGSAPKNKMCLWFQTIPHWESHKDSFDQGPRMISVTVNGRVWNRLNHPEPDTWSSGNSKWVEFIQRIPNYANYLKLGHPSETKRQAKNDTASYIPKQGFSPNTPLILHWHQHSGIRKIRIWSASQKRYRSYLLSSPPHTKWPLQDCYSWVFTAHITT